MTVYSFPSDLQFGDVDPTFQERHYTYDATPNILKRNLLHKLQERFCELGFEYIIGNINGCFNNKTLAAVLSFQKQSMYSKRRRKNLFTNEFELVDVPITFKGASNGVFDKPTADEFDLWLRCSYFNSCDCPLIKFEKTWARPEIAEALVRTEKAIRMRGGAFPTNFIACFRNPANVTISAGMKQHSVHHTGLAFDYDEWRGMQDPSSDYYFVESAENNEFWKVFVRSISPDIPQSTHKFVFFDSLRSCYFEHELTGQFISLTDVFAAHGLKPIKRHTNWEREYYLTEWWHFENTSTMTSWQSEMVKIGYTEEFLARLKYI